MVSPLLACDEQEEEESLAETGKEEQGEKQDQKSSAEDAGEEQGEEKQQSPGQAETAPPKAESQKKEEGGEKSESQVSVRLKEWDCDFSVREVEFPLWNSSFPVSTPPWKKVAESADLFLCLRIYFIC